MKLHGRTRLTPRSFIRSLTIRMTSHPCNKYEQITLSYLLSVKWTTGGVQCRGGILSFVIWAPWGDIMVHMRGYHEYRGGTQITKDSLLRYSWYPPTPQYWTHIIQGSSEEFSGSFPQSVLIVIAHKLFLLLNELFNVICCEECRLFTY